MVADFHDRAVCLIIIDTGTLSEAADHPSCLVAIEAPVVVVLHAEYPLAAHDMGTGGPRNQLPSLISLEGIKLGLHGRTPVGIFERSVNGVRNGRHRCGGGDASVARIGLERADTRTCGHRVQAHGSIDNWWSRGARRCRWRRSR